MRRLWRWLTWPWRRSALSGVVYTLAEGEVIAIQAVHRDLAAAVSLTTKDGKVVPVPVMYRGTDASGVDLYDLVIPPGHDISALRLHPVDGQPEAGPERTDEAWLSRP